MIPENFCVHFFLFGYFSLLHTCLNFFPAPFFETCSQKICKEKSTQKESTKNFHSNLQIYFFHTSCAHPDSLFCYHCSRWNTKIKVFKKIENTRMKENEKKKKILYFKNHRIQTLIVSFLHKNPKYYALVWCQRREIFFFLPVPFFLYMSEFLFFQFLFFFVLSSNRQWQKRTKYYEKLFQILNQKNLLIFLNPILEKMVKGSSFFIRKENVLSCFECLTE